MIGKIISHYKVLEKIGEGGMGEVYLAMDTELNRRVALKFLPPEYAFDTEALTRFKCEAQAAAALDHPNIITIYDVAEHENRPYFVMAYVEGESLSDVIAKRDLSLDRVLEIASQICRGLGKAHEASIVHRDIKPDNVVIDTDGQPRILDFGLAKLRGVSKLTQEHSTLGTLNYMSPEQVRGEDVDHRSDFFSLGAVLYEMITGKRPFEGDHPAAVVYLIGNEEPQPLRRYNRDIPDELERIVSKALAKRADERYQSADDLLVDLRSAQETVALGAPAKRRADRRSHMRVLVGTILVIAAAAAAYFFLPRNGESPITDRKSIAVLPFKNLSADPENEYFSDGITEDIIAQLSKIADLRVVSCTSVMRYKDSEKSVREIGKELGVATILEGSVRRAEGRVRILSQFIDARSDEHIWAETYDRELSEIFKIQSDVAERIAHSLETRLTADEASRIRAQPTGSTEAYDYYLRGRQSYNRYRKEENEKAIAFFNKALELDPNYALAYSGLGDAYGQRANLYGSAREWVDSAIRASERAIAINPDLAEGHKALALAYSIKGWFKKSLAANLKAVELDPGLDVAIGNLGVVYVNMGQPDKAIPYLRKSTSLRRRPMWFTYLGAAYAVLGERDEARYWLNRSLEMGPVQFLPHYYLIQIDLQDRRFDAARTHIQELVRNPETAAGGYLLAAFIEGVATRNLVRVRELLEQASDAINPDAAHAVIFKPMIDSYLACTLWQLGEHDKALPRLKQASAFLQYALSGGNEDHLIRVPLAAMEAVQGHKTKALEWVQSAIDTGELDYVGLEQHPFLENLHDDERFKAKMAELQARVEEMRQRVKAYEQ